MPLLWVVILPIHLHKLESFHDSPEYVVVMGDGISVRMTARFLVFQSHFYTGKLFSMNSGFSNLKNEKKIFEEQICKNRKYQEKRC